MTYLHDDPASFAFDALDGLCDVYSELLLRVDGGVVRRYRSSEPKVAVLYGGGSGHYPAFAGLVGPGMGAGAVCGNIFTSPSSDDAVHVARTARSGAGVVFSYGNYAGDVMNFGVATQRLRDEGIETENVIVTDDVASAPRGSEEKRRGIAGDFTVFKVMGAAAERGDDLAEVARLGRKANDATRTMGVAFAGCTMPGAGEPLFALPDGEMGVGLGIHGEPGLEDVPLVRAAELGRLLVDRVLAERPEPPTQGTQRAAVILNGLGRTKYEELFVLWRTVGPHLRKDGIEIVVPEVDEIVTSLDMAGTSLTLMYLDDELEELWLAPARTPAWTRGAVETDARDAVEVSTEDVRASEVKLQATPESRDAAATALALLETTLTTLRQNEAVLGQLDAVAGDGDHGRGMSRGAQAAVTAAREADDHGAGVAHLLAAAGDAWAAKAGGTSGALWGAALRAVGRRLGNETSPTAQDLAEAARTFITTIQELGGATLGDKTLLDAADPYAAEFAERVAAGDDLATTAASAATAACDAAQGTADLVPQVGRARPLAERSKGTPDPGAVSFSLIVTEFAGPAR